MAEKEKSYRMDMKDEKGAGGNKMPQGWHDFKVASFEPKMSKPKEEGAKSNLYFKCIAQALKEEYNGHTITMRLTALKGKRWMLKGLINSIGQAPKNPDEEYEIIPSKIVNKEFAGKVFYVQSGRFTNEEIVSVEKKGFTPPVKKTKKNGKKQTEEVATGEGNIPGQEISSEELAQAKEFSETNKEKISDEEIPF